MNRSGEEPAAAPRLQLLRTLSAQEREARARAEADARAAEAAAADAGARLAAVRAEAEAIRIVRLERPVRASVAAKSVRVREGAAKDSAAVGRLPKGEEVELLELQRTPSGSVRARTADGWVTASTGAKGKRLLDAEDARHNQDSNEDAPPISQRDAPSSPSRRQKRAKNNGSAIVQQQFDHAHMTLAHRHVHACHSLLRGHAGGDTCVQQHNGHGWP